MMGKITNNNKMAIWALSIISLLLLINTFLKQYSEKKINEYQNNIFSHQLTLNHQGEKVAHYLARVNQDELVLFTLSLNSDIKFVSKTSRFIPSNTIEQKFSELRGQLSEGKISPLCFYERKLTLESQLYKEAFDNFNKMNDWLLFELTHKPSWIFWNNVFTLSELTLILISIILQVLLLLRSSTN